MKHLISVIESWKESFNFGSLRDKDRKTNPEGYYQDFEFNTH